MANGNPYGGFGPAISAASNPIAAILGLAGVPNASDISTAAQIGTTLAGVPIPNPLSGPLAPLSAGSVAAQASQLGATDPVTGQPIATLGMPQILGGRGIVSANPAVAAAYAPQGTLEPTPLGLTPTFAPDPSTSMATSPFADYTGTAGTRFGGSLGTNNTTDANGMAVGAGTGNSVPGSTDFGTRADPDANPTTQVPDAPPPDANLAEGNTGTPGSPGPVGIGEGAAPGTPGGIGTAVSGDAPGTGDAGGTAGNAGDGGGSAGTAGGAGVMKRGGRVGRPDPRQLAAKLRAGSRVTAGNPRSTRDDVPVVLQRNEEVMNRPAVKAHAQQLDAWNRQGRRQMDRSPGGFAVKSSQR